MQIRPWLAVLAVLAAALPPTAPTALAALAAEPPGRRPADPVGPGTWVTLVTGDSVAIRPGPGGRESVTFRPVPGSRSPGAVTSRAGGRTLVIPYAALPGVAAGRLDRELFDVTALVAGRYADDRTGTLPVIVRYANQTRAKAATPRGITASRTLTSIAARAVTVRKATAAAFWQSVANQPGVTRISLDRRVTAVTDRSVPQIGAPAAWQRGHTGSGVKVAVLDTGIDATHPDLTGKITASADFSGSADTTDHVGHGTHVAGTIAGTGSASGGQHRGVAPDAALLNGKVLDDQGNGTQSGIIAGMEWAAAQGADVVNLSLGTREPSDGTDPVSDALNALSRDSGPLFVVAAGNCQSPAAGTIGSPAAADDALTVANLQRDGSLHDTSCRGPRTGDHLLKPEIAAPGSGIVAARATGTTIGEPAGPHYTALTGTSMATPHVAGTAALLAQAQPGLTAAELKNRLITSADPQVGSDVNGQGAGRVDADQATTTGVTVGTAELELGELTAEQPVTRTLTYRNPGSVPITLDLTVAMDDGDGPAPALSDSQLTLAAGAEAGVRVTVAPADGNQDHSGRVLATPVGGGDPIVTTVGWSVATGTHHLTVTASNPDGTRAASGVVLANRVDGQPGGAVGFLLDGKVSLELEDGRYDLAVSYGQEPSATSRIGVTVAAIPELEVSADRTAEFDGGKAVRASFAVEGHPELHSSNRGLSYKRVDAAGTLVTELRSDASGGIDSYTIPSPAATTGGLEFGVIGRLEQPMYAARSLGPGGTDIPVSEYPRGAPRFDGTRTLPVVDAGVAAPADLTDVSGKLAVIRRTPDVQVGEQVLAAQQAGARAALVYDTTTMYYPIELFEPAGATIPTMNARWPDAQRLLDLAGHRRVEVRVTGTSASRTSYHLVKAYTGAVPAQPSYTAEQAEFARVDQSFAAPGPAATMSEMWIGSTPLGASSGLIRWPETPLPFRRTSYLLGGSTPWFPQVELQNLDLGSAWFGVTRTYRAGETNDQRWFGPVLTAGTPDGPAGYEQVSRTGSVLAVGMSPMMHRDHWEIASLSPAGNHRLVVYRDGQQIAEGALWAFADVPPSPADYRISLDSSRDLP